jgi:hypothetical protein
VNSDDKRFQDVEPTRARNSSPSHDNYRCDRDSRKQHEWQKPKRFFKAIYPLFEIGDALFAHDPPHFVNIVQFRQKVTGLANQHECDWKNEYA